jgi:UDP-2-acetamido-3-amino-2,3-dideoxy-glucuronate N-acetyltransferase
MIHPTAIVEADLHESVTVWAFAHVSKGAKIGKNVMIGEGVFIDKDVVIGDNCRIQNNALIYKGVHIGQNTFIGPNVVTTNDIEPDLRKSDWSERFKTTYIGNNVAIGANSTIVCGIHIYDGALIGAGSVVTKNVGMDEVWYGNPATYQRKRG